MEQTSDPATDATVASIRSHLFSDDFYQQYGGIVSTWIESLLARIDADRAAIREMREHSPERMPSPDAILRAAIDLRIQCELSNSDAASQATLIAMDIAGELSG
jgi:hypothetical protein